MSTSALTSARNGFGIVSSWRPLRGLTGGLPLDHILHSDELQAVKFERGPWLGSDHQPILASLRWRDDVPRSALLATATATREEGEAEAARASTRLEDSTRSD
jgi:hypothetical protein